MIKSRISSITFYIMLATLIFSACSNGNQETSADIDNSDQIESMTDAEQNKLFIIEADSLYSSWENVEESNSRQKRAILNPGFVSMDSSAVGQEFIFNIYDEKSLPGKVNRVSTDMNNVTSISGLLHEDKGSFVFTVNEGFLLGQLRLTESDKIVQIRFSEELNEYLLIETNRRDLDVLPGSRPMMRGNN